MLKQARQFQGDQGCRFGWFQDYGITRCQSGCQFLHFRGNGRVPGCDGGHHPQGLMHTHGQPLSGPGIGQLCIQGFQTRGGITGRGGSTHHQTTRFCQRLAVVSCLQSCQLGHILLDQIGHFIEHPSPLHGQAIAPGGLLPGPVRGLNSLLHIVQAGGRKLGIHATVCWKNAGRNRPPALPPMAGQK
mgnify:CR=1 FL=1